MKEKGYWVWIVLVAIVVLLNLPVPASLRVKAGVRDDLAPFQNVLSILVTKTRDWFSAVAHASATAVEKEDMLKDMAELRQRVRELDPLAQENEALREQLDFKSRSRRELVFCSVVSREISGWWQAIRINKGSEDGIQPDMAVITSGGVVGQVRTVSRNAADVLLISDPNCRVSCRFERTGAFGILMGQGVSLKGRNEMEMLFAPEAPTVEYLSNDDLILADDAVFTSGLGSVYPAGLPVGRVVRVVPDPSGLFQRAQIAPAADLDKLSYVFVIAEQRKPETKAKGK